MESADQLGPQVPDVLVPLRQQPQHLGMIGRLDRPKSRCTECGDGHRAGVVRIVLVRLPGSEHPHPRRQSRRDVEDVLPGVDELLGQRDSRDRRRTRSPRCARSKVSAHPSSRSVCRLVARTVIVASSVSPQSMATAVWVALCGSIPMMTDMSTSSLRRLGTARALLISIRCARSSFEPLGGKDPEGSSSFDNQIAHGHRQALQERPRRVL